MLPEWIYKPLQTCARIFRRIRKKVLPGSEIDYRALLEGSLDLICVARIVHHRPTFIYASQSALEVLGWRAEELLSLPIKTFFTPDAMLAIKADIERLEVGYPASVVEIEGVRKDGTSVWVENKVSVIDRIPGGMTVMVCMRDVTKRKQLEDQLAEMALVDGLTGVANRRAFDQVIDQEWRRSLRHGIALSLILFDLDHFKRLNDEYGHQFGDDCLRTIAQTVRGHASRSGDTVARYGGEEFAILLSGTDSESAEKLANLLCRAVADLQIPHRGNKEAGGIVTISCGVSTALPRLGGTISMPQGLLQAADSALYRAKDQGRNRAVSSLLLSPMGSMQAAS